MPNVKIVLNACLAKLLLVSIVLTLCHSADAQDYLNTIGDPTFLTTIPVDNGAIDLNNGNLHLEIPISSPAQRGGSLSASQSLTYDGRIWQIVATGSGSYSWQPTNIPSSQAGWRFVQPTAGNAGSISDTSVPCDSPPPIRSAWVRRTFGWTDPAGTGHDFPITTQQPVVHNNPCYDPSQLGTPSGNGLATDGSGYHMYVTNYTTTVVYDGSGRQVFPKIEDNNGNYFSTDANGNLIDTLGHTPVLASTSGTITYYDVLGFQGARNRYTVTYGSIHLQTAFNQSGIAEYSGTLTAIQSIALPGSGGSYQFTYDSYGEIASVTLPTGGTVSYGYTNFVDSYQARNRWVTSQIRDGGTWTYSPAVVTQCSAGGTGCIQKVTMTTPGSDDTVYTFILNNGAWNSEIDRYRGSSASGGTLLQANKTTYDFSNQCNSAYCSGAEYVRAVNMSTTLADVGLTRSQSYTYDSPATGNVISTKVWDFYSGSQPANPTQETDYVYGYTGIHALPSVTQATVVSYASGSAGTVSQQTFGYDQSGLVPVSNLSNHETLSGNRANLTSMSQWINTGGTLATTYTLDDAGMRRTSTDPNGTTSYGYDATGSFVTALTPPTPSSGVSLATTATVDSNTGATLTTTDPNGGVTSVTSYDAFLRPNEAFKPNGERVFYGYSANQIGVDEEMGVSGTQDVQTLFDGYGRKSRVAVGDGQSINPYYQIDYCYNTTGQLQFQSKAYQGNGWGTPKQCAGFGTSYSYDALNRPTAISNADATTTSYTYTGRATKVTTVDGIQTIVQVDGLGRTNALCELSSNGNMPASGAPQNCGLDIPGTGFITAFTYDLANHKTTVAQGVQTRIFQVDSLGRTILTQEPESGATTHSYAYNSTGLVVARQHPRANQTNPSVLTTTTSQYDSLGRLTSVTYDDGTVNKYYAYDQASNWNTNLGQSKGHLTYAWTQPFWVGTQFSYDIMGRVTQTQECFPYHCGNYVQDVTRLYSYDLGGNLTKESYFMNLSSGTQVDTNYTFSKAREVTSISNTLTGTINDSGSILSTVQNGPFGPTNYNFGNGLNGINTYDNIGRLYGNWVCNGSNQPTCTGGTQLYGNVSNQQGFRVSSIIDTILNTPVGFGYDEFNRVISSNYSYWNTSFSYVYDRYGNRWSQNVTQGSGPSPQLAFNTANNHIVGFSYDAAGNLLSDGLHSYTYDAEGNVLKVDGGSTATYVYNALNQRVQSIASGSNEEYAYDLNGQRSTVWNGTPSVPSLISATTYWNGRPISFYNGATYFQHQDVQGTERLRTAYDGSASGSYQNFAFGDGSTVSGTDNDPYHFAQLDRDSESGTDHAQFRQYSSTAGRWMSPDTYGGSYDPGNPQSFNRYSYVLNNPFSLVDPSGLVPCRGGGDQDDSHFVSGGRPMVHGEPPCTPPVPPPHHDPPPAPHPPGSAGGAGGSSQTPSNSKRTLPSCLGQALHQHGNNTALALDAIGDLGLLLPADQPVVGFLQTAIASASAYNSYNQDVTARNVAAGSVSLGGGVVSTITPAAKFVASGSTFVRYLPFAGGVLSGISTANDLSNYAGDISACMNGH
jgi:RHS repeat-associated protein